MLLEEGVRMSSPTSRHERTFTNYRGHSAGQDATEVFFSLHRYEVLERPQYKRLQVGVIQGEDAKVFPTINNGEISKVPYAEPTWLVEGYHSPYFTEVCPT